MSHGAIPALQPLCDNPFGIGRKIIRATRPYHDGGDHIERNVGLASVFCLNDRRPRPIMALLKPVSKRPKCSGAFRGRYLNSPI